MSSRLWCETYSVAVAVVVVVVAVSVANAVFCRVG